MLAVILLILSSVSLVACECYCMRDSMLFDCSGTENVCGYGSSVDSGAQLCCVAGDVCGKDSICHFSKPITNTSGYYLGGCTDPNYRDPVCQNRCTDAGTSDIVYNSTSQLWSCCGYPDNTVSCQNPRTDTTFQAIALEEFPGTSAAAPSSSRASSSSSSTSSSMSSMTTSSATTATPTASAASASGTVPVSQSSSQLSTGATAGIAVAAVLIGLAIIAGLTFWFILRRRRAADEADDAAAANMPGYFDTPGYIVTKPPINAGGIPEIYTENEDSNVATNAYYCPGRSDTLHESDNRIVPAQLHGSESLVQELP